MYEDHDASVQLEEAPDVVEPPRDVLIIEDDPSQREVLQTRLSRLGYQTKTAERGDEGLRQARCNVPDVILLDVRLPDTSGFDVCEQLDDDPATSGVPVIIVSGMEEPQIVRRARQCGCRFFVRKPYDPNVLLTLIEAAIEG